MSRLRHRYPKSSDFRVIKENGLLQRKRIVENFLQRSPTTTHTALPFEEAQTIKRRRRLRIGLPIALVVLLLAALVAIAIYDFRVMRADALTLSKGVIGNLQHRIETEVAAYLGPIPGVVRFTRDLLADEKLLSVRRELGEKVAIGILNHTPQITAVIIGTPIGEFFMVRRFRDGAQHGLETKTIRWPDGPTGAPVMRLTRRDPSGKVVSDEPTPWDGYDPRGRPWFAGAAQRKDLFWTDVYPFFTSQSAGITGSVPYLDTSGALVAVVGADVELDNLSDFLATLTIGETGIALIIDDEGRIIAHPQKPLVTSDASGEVKLLRIEDIDDPVVSRAIDHYLVEGHGRRDFELAGRRYISAASSLNHLIQRDWSILVIVPEDDFVGFVAENVREVLALGLVVIALAGLIAGFVVRHGLRTDREALAVLERQTLLDAQGEAFGTLAIRAALFDTGRSNANAEITEAVARATQVRRVSLWRLLPPGDALVCVDCFDQQYSGHTEGATLHRSAHPCLFGSLQEEIAASDVETADRGCLATLQQSYLSPFGLGAILSVPLVVDGQLTGTLWLEDVLRSEWPNHLVRFMRSIANLVAIREASGETPAPVKPIASGQAQPTVARGSHPDTEADLDARRAAAFADKLADYTGTQEQAGTQTIDKLAVVSLRFTDMLALAGPVSDGSGEPSITRVLGQIEQAATKHGLGYLKLLTDQLVAAADPTADPLEGVVRLAEFALDAQAACERLFAEQHAPLAFHLGMDLGPTIGTLVGHESRSFNLWGEAPVMASAMADSAPPGAIHTTASVYQSLHGRYLFQLRGQHYLEHVGEFSTYLLAGRL